MPVPDKKAASADEKFMRLAIDQARAGVRLGQAPFGACLVVDGNVLAAAHNCVWANNDITAHAEIEVIRQACQKQRKVFFPAGTLYSTVEPCPMCFSAAHWSRIRRIVYGLSIADARRFGFRELPISVSKMAEMSGDSVPMTTDVLRTENQAVWREWLQQKGHRAY